MVQIALHSATLSSAEIISLTFLIGGLSVIFAASYIWMRDTYSTTSDNSNAPKTRSTRLQTAHTVLANYKLLSPSALVEPLAPNGTHKVLPESLGIPQRSREEFEQHAKGFTSIFTAFEMQPQQIYDAPEQNSVVAYCKMVGTLVGGMGPWTNECMITMKMNSEGTKVVEYREFVDSARAAILKEKLGKFFASKAKGEDMMNK